MMIARFMVCLGLMFFPLAAQAYTNFSKVTFRFLRQAPAATFLSTPDDFLRNITSMTLSLLHQTSADVSLTEHKRFLESQALDWTPEEIQLVQGEITQMEQAVNALGLSLSVPPEVDLIKTTGEDEFKAHYTRGNAIIFPVESAANGVTTDAPTVFHEFFHIVSRFRGEAPDSAAFHDRLYALCGYQRIPEPKLPLGLSSLALTNPDAFRYQHAIEVMARGAIRRVIPFFYSGISQQNVKPPVDEAAVFKLGLLDLDTLTMDLPVLYVKSETDYNVRTRANTHYTIHPEEIMAENFRLLLMRQAGLPLPSPLPHPEVLDELQRALSEPLDSRRVDSCLSLKAHCQLQKF